MQLTTKPANAPKAEKNVTYTEAISAKLKLPNLNKLKDHENTKFTIKNINCVIQKFLLIILNKHPYTQQYAGMPKNNIHNAKSLSIEAVIPSIRTGNKPSIKQRKYFLKKFKALVFIAALPCFELFLARFL